MLQDAGLSVADDAYLSDAAMLGWGTAAIAVAVLAFCLLRRYFGRGGRSAAVTKLGVLLGVFAATFFLLLPVAWAVQGMPLTTLFQAIFLTIQSPTLNSGAADVVAGQPASAVGAVYYTLLHACYVALPILAIWNLSELLEQGLSQVKLRWICRFSVRNKTAYVFSDLDSTAIALVEAALEQDAAAEVVFTNASHAERDEFSDKLAALDSNKVHCVSADFSEFARELCGQFRFGRVHFFALSEDAAQNVARTCRAFEQLRGSRNEEDLAEFGAPAFFGDAAKENAARVKFYVRIDSADDQLVLDAANSSEGGAAGACSLPLRTLKEESLAAISLLDKAPLYSALDDEPATCESLRPAAPQDLDVLVLGSGSFAESVVLNILSMGQMYNVRLNVTLADASATELEARMRFRCRGLFGEPFAEEKRELFRLSFVDCALRSQGLYSNVFEPLASSRHLYIVAATSDGDAVNHELALAARIFFLERTRVDCACPMTPRVAALLRDEAVARLVSSELDISRKNYGIVTFGSDTFAFESVLGSELERGAQGANDLYSYLYNMPTDGFGVEDVDPELLLGKVEELLESRRGKGLPPSENISTMSQIVYHSNLAQVLHMRYKAWAMGLDTSQGVEANQGLRITSDVILSLSTVEHNRWWTMYLAFGYTYLAEEERVRFARLFGNDNRLRKIEPIKKHALVCPNGGIWESYVRAVSGFAYEQGEEVSRCGETTLVVEPALDGVSLGVSFQLVTADEHQVIDAWTMGEGAYELCGLPAGAYVVHPASAREGYQCADDSEVVAIDGRPGTVRIAAPTKCASSLTNTSIYDMAFCCSVWWRALNS